ncbi:PTS sugar transporter subunit IIB [Lactovum miscens]|uniref:PTS system cellobiose-specific IIB component n=1 Tax=Lactovum miscens TaxID=190387 RepID=A0A841C903_9LACT|nr:PTS sugar transporter subunit IIB [Lactovum miscens]MBB5887700.1 PTS system cellobiose-specific IIB component [Lactovum miscens]
MAGKIIALACAAGMSTSLLVKKMQDAAKAQGKDYEIFAKSTSEADQMLHATPAPDVLLLGPQVAYQKAQMKKIADSVGIPLDVINMQDYGMMKGDRVLAQAEKLMGL